MHHFPYVSVIMPVYNASKFLDEALKSTLEQSYENFEFVIVDDCSTDSSYELLNEYAAIDNRILLLRNENNLGYRESLNIALSRSRSRYIARMDADDINRPTRLEKQFNFLEANPDIGVLGTSAEIIDSEGNHLSKRCVPLSHGYIIWTMLFKCPIIHPSVMMRRYLLLEVGGYNSDVVAEDYDLWWRLRDRTNFSNLPDVLFRLRKHSGNISELQQKNFLESSYHICANGISGKLCEVIPIEMAQGLWREHPSSSQMALKIGNLLAQIFDALSSEFTKEEQQVIRSDLSRRFLRLALSDNYDPRVLSLIKDAVRYDPIFPLNYLRRRLKLSDDCL